MEILLDKRALRQIRLSAQDAIEEGDSETLREDILESFSEEQVEEIERRIDSDYYDFLGDMLEEWGGEDIDELLELLEAALADVGIELKFNDEDDGDDDEEAEEELDADEDLDLEGDADSGTEVEDEDD